ncbi:MAG TPA: putative peptidoglycan glycosyltransferase FtsW [Candidatus Paceibacterota bacterium]
MTHSGKMPDTIFLAITALIVCSGVFIFMSASFGLLARAGAGWGSVLFSQFALGLGGGLAVALVAYFVPLQFLRRYAFYLFILAILATLLVFVPGLGLKAGGAARWVLIGNFSFQPSEILKITLVLFLATWFASLGKDIQSARYGLLPFVGILAITGVVIVSQPDNGTFMVMFATAVAMFLAAGGRFLHLAYMGLGAVVLVGVLALTRPYVMDRIETFINPAADPLGGSYQIRQSLLAIGSGQATGKGFGQSTQKFQYLPEPIGDSIFAVLGEEFGFLGTLFVLALFIALGLRGLHIATRAPDRFSRLLVTGLVIMISAQAFLNMGAMMGLVPLTGIPLPFISHGGTALMFMLVASALVLSASRYHSSIKPA